jgi:hypothetical protein
MIRAMTLVACLMAGSVVAQSSVRTTDGSGAMLRSLDRITGQVLDFELKNGEQFQRGKMNVTLRECRYPRRAIDRDAFVYLTINDDKTDRTVFDGWMMASSPAISALEHPRFDVWVLKCLAPA